MKHFNSIISSMAIAFFILSCQPSTVPVKTELELGAISASTMVTSAHPLATKAGLEILKRGGNAIDATVAVHFALQVVFPEAGNIGGGGFAVIRESNGDISSLDFREKAPLRASKDMYLGETGEVIQGLSRIGHKAVGVPGSVAGMWELHQKKGSMPWEDLVKPAMDLSYNGHLLTAIAAQNLNDKQEDFKKTNRYIPWVVKENGWNAGDSSIQRELANTFSQISKYGRDGFYKGIVADQIVKEMQLGGGLISAEDLEAYQPKWREPVEGNYRGYRVISMPPPSSGGVALIQLLYGAEKLDMKKTGHNTPESIHIKTELERRVYADRATHLGDPDFYDVPMDMLLDEQYLSDRFSDINKNTKTPSGDIKEGAVEIIESVETTHYSIVDEAGNAVSVTTTLNGYYGSKVMVKGSGFFLNNEMDDFSAKPGEPNMFGLVGAEANAIAPEKRMLSSMTPTILEKDGELFMVTGTPGGATIITSVFQSVLNVVDYGMSMQEAVNARRFHSQWLPDVILYEEGAMSNGDSLKLTEFGHELRSRSQWGKVDAILKRPDGSYEGAADPRSDDYAEGY